MLAFLQRLKENLALFQRMQLVCEGHLRSFTGNTYVRLRATLAYAYEGDEKKRPSLSYGHLPRRRGDHAGC